MSEGSGAIIEQLAEILQQRRSASPEESYVAGLYQAGLDRILKKVGEESNEVIIAAKGNSHDDLVHEIADLWFHVLVLMNEKGVKPVEVFAELESRMGRSGLVEKADRQKG